MSATALRPKAVTVGGPVTGGKEVNGGHCSKDPLDIEVSTVLIVRVAKTAFARSEFIDDICVRSYITIAKLICTEVV